MKKSTLKLKSIPTEIHKIEKFVEDICDYNNINNTYFGNILVAVTEAFENALTHGNQSDPKKCITIGFEVKPKGLMFEISDEGPGFDVSSVPDATDVENNPDKKGTGLFLIRSLADEVRHIANGKCIQILFYISSINQQIASERINQLNAFKKESNEKSVKKDPQK
jgi:serine/threonine-protein kinase RsbW